jgi:hypothetical protein
MKGRIVVDCGYTKLLPHHWAKTAGTERYVRNVAVWLLALDYRIKIGAPLQGDIVKKPLKKAPSKANKKQEKEAEKMETEKEKQPEEKGVEKPVEPQPS